ncbi:gelsolin-like protein 1 [Liolophura sinensis]|uniref:gelsolin-like protein 1 n=1 Tax=Liolophura sinensis TaxID=3198878 RepID=UPI003158D7E7
MMKPKKYDWKDSNLALFGSDTERKVKKESAQSEPAWEGAGGSVGLKIWRIVKFKVTEWPKEDYGKFYSGDSYIVLNTYKADGSDELLYDVHFWIGKYSSQDEYGTAAYKTVELDTFLDDKPIQHREVQGHESQLFKSYFPSLELMRGGAETGFRQVQPEEYKPRLFHVVGERKSVVVKEIGTKKENINECDVFILDLGLRIFQYNGEKANKDEKFKAMQYLQKLKSERGGKPSTEILEGDSTPKSHEFFSSLSEGKGPKKTKTPAQGPPKLYKVSDEDGSMDMDEVKEGPISLSDFDSKDVFVLDLVNHVFVWVGKEASRDERRNALSYAHSHLMKSDHPFASIECVVEGPVGNGRVTQALAA